MLREWNDAGSESIHFATLTPNGGDSDEDLGDLLALAEAEHGALRIMLGRVVGLLERHEVVPVSDGKALDELRVEGRFLLVVAEANALLKGAPTTKAR